ncbi:MAG TPA: class II aldolase/adducin family protein [Candidatus Limnocylindria bacterium]|nr:class II aldolase/adducin family protein [Candidatus Limnocylindria bacterium]
MSTPVEQLLWLAHEMGRPELGLVTYSEGDASRRLDDDRFCVTASNCQLSNLALEDLVECHAAKILALLDMPLFDSTELDRTLMQARVDDTAKRPSLAAAFHALLLQFEGVNFVAHCSPPACVQVLCSPMAEAFAEQRLFPDQVVHCGVQSVFVPYADPGSTLAREVRSRVSLQQRRTSRGVPKLIVLQNNGIIALGATAESVLSTLLTAEKSARVFLGSAVLGGPTFLKPGQSQRLDSPIGGLAAVPERPRLLKP